jgi:hypothetical protein
VPCWPPAGWRWIRAIRPCRHLPGGGRCLARTGDDGPLLTLTLLISGLFALKENDLERARQQLEEVRTLAVTQEPIKSAMATASLGQVTMALGDLEAAQALCEEALAIHQAGSGPTGIAFGHLYMGQVSLARDDHVGQRRPSGRRLSALPPRRDRSMRCVPSKGSLVWLLPVGPIALPGCWGPR